MTASLDDRAKQVQVILRQEKGAETALNIMQGFAVERIDDSSRLLNDRKCVVQVDFEHRSQHIQQLAMTQKAAIRADFDSEPTAQRVKRPKVAMKTKFTLKKVMIRYVMILSRRCLAKGPIKKTSEAASSTKPTASSMSLYHFKVTNGQVTTKSVQKAR
jgi:hypothetical protein